MADLNFIQWNIDGIRNKKDELLELVERHQVSIMAIQETKITDSFDFKLPTYNIIKREGHVNVTTHGGVALFIHSDIPYQEIHLNTALQAVAARINANGKLLSICSVYIPQSQRLTIDMLHNLKEQLPSPTLLMGDFNAYNIMWGSITTGSRGTIVESFMRDKELNILNNGSPTRVGYQTETAIDLTLCSPEIAAMAEWRVYTSPRDSDHCPVVITLMNDNLPLDCTEKYNMKRADWKVYEKCDAWKDMIDNGDGNNELLQEFYERIWQASDAAIPKSKISKFYPKPWWTPEVKKSKQIRERLYQLYRRNKSYTNLINWKRKRAQHKKLVRESKRSSWIQFVETININTPPQMLYENIRRIKGKPQRKINILYDDGIYFTTVPEICNKLAQTFAKISSSFNYDREFQNHKVATERNSIHFTSANTEVYNQDFSIHELEASLRNRKETAPGPDGVYYKMLKHMPTAAKHHLLKIYNRFWSTAYVPQQWREAIVIPIPKPDKNHSNPINYRPIALTSCLCKTMERMINHRLCSYLEMNGIIDKIQCGSIKNRSTTDHLVRLENRVRTSFARDEHLVSVFYDLEKAYDTTWRYGILKDLYQAGLRGRLPMFIAAFLRDRTFRVRVGQQISELHKLENGVPQGSILSVTLFTVKINQIAAQIPRDPNFHASLYVDDLQVAYRHTDINIIEQKLQQCLDDITSWATLEGFKFSTTKTKVMHFTRRPGVIRRPTLQLYGQALPYVDRFKFLGVLWDEKLTWTPHISKLKAECNKRLGIMRSIATHEWGTDQYCLMKIYRMLIRSKIDYGAAVYNSASTTYLNSLDSIASDAMRIATGAFKSTPVDSLHAITNEPPLQLRRNTIILRYYYKIRSSLNNPAFEAVVDTHHYNLFKNKGLSLPLSLKVLELKRGWNMKQVFIKPNFSYRLLGIVKPTWALEPLDINLELVPYSRMVTSDIEYKAMFERIREGYGNIDEIYTD